MADYDVVIIGCGPAGLQAAIHAARQRAKVMVLGRLEASSLFKAHIENYLCVPGVTLGEEMLKIGVEQAKTFGAEVIHEDAVSTSQDNDIFYVEAESGQRLSTYALIICTGVSRKGLGIPREKEFVGKGISYCVDCDANFYKGAKVAVVGDGSAAAHGALTLSKIASEVHLITKNLDVSKSLLDELKHSNVQIHEGRSIKELKGDNELKAIVLDNDQEISVDGLFIEKGAKGAMQLAAFLGVNLDPEKFTYIVTNKKQETNIEGIYAAGDICGPPLQMAKAVGEGCVAGYYAGRYALKKRRKENKGNDS